MMHVEAQHLQIQSLKRRAFGFDTQLLLKRRRVQTSDDPLKEAPKSSASLISFPSMSQTQPSQFEKESSIPAAVLAKTTRKLVGFGDPRASDLSRTSGSPRSSLFGDVPWWLRTQAAGHQENSALCCYYCAGPREEDDHISCQRCEHNLCEMCTRACDACTATWCPCCTIVDYDSPVERTVCFDCHEDEQTHSRGLGCPGSISPGIDSSLDSEGGDIMLSWE